MSYGLVIIWELYRGDITKVHPQLCLIYDRGLTLTILFSQFTSCKYRLARIFPHFTFEYFIRSLGVKTSFKNLILD